MRVRILKPSYKLEFDGAPSIWNDYFRPLLGGPVAPPDPVPAAAAAPPAGVPFAGAAPAVGSPPPMVRTFAPPEFEVSPGQPIPASGPPVAARPAVRTWFPPREPRADRPARDDDRRRAPAAVEEHDDRSDTPPWRRRGGPEPEIRIEASNDPKVLYDRLLALGSRRSEKDAVLAAVWFVGRDDREVHEREVDQHLKEHGAFDDIKVRPAVAKHITRTKLLEAGTQPGFVRLSRKGREQIRLLCGV